MKWCDKIGLSFLVTCIQTNRSPNQSVVLEIHMFTDVELGKWGIVRKFGGFVVPTKVDVLLNVSQIF